MADKQEEHEFLINTSYLFLMFFRLLEKDTFTELIFNRDGLGRTVVENILTAIHMLEHNDELRDELFMTTFQGDITHVISFDSYVQRMLAIIAGIKIDYAVHLLQRLGLNLR